MIVGGRPINDITLEDIYSLVKTFEPESATLSYIKTIDWENNEGILELLQTTVAMANSEGGYIIVGIAKNKDSQAHGLNPITNLKSYIQNICQAYQTSIRDKIKGVEIIGIEAPDSTGFIAIKVLKSNQQPHMVSQEKNANFFRRTINGNRVMTLEEIRWTILNDPDYQRNFANPGVTKKNSHPPFVRIFTDKSVDQFLQKFIVCEAHPMNLVIVSPFISDLAGEQIDLQDVIEKINAGKIRTYVITRSPKEIYQKISMDLLQQSPYVELRYNEDIHAKLFICWCREMEDKSFALFGSGNLTKGGLRQNLELGMMVYAQDHGKTIVRDLYEWSTSGLRTQSKRIKAATHV